MRDLKKTVKTFKSISGVTLETVIATYDMDESVREDMEEYYVFFVTEILTSITWMDIEAAEDEEVEKLAGEAWSSSRWETFIDPKNGDLFVEGTFAVNSDDGLSNVTDTQPFCIKFEDWDYMKKKES